MPSVYLQSSEYATYGIPDATDDQIILASSLIDTYLKRPEGLVWVPDANGNPCYMSALTPLVSLTTTQAISPGQNINVTVSGAVAAVQQGFVAILDKADDNKREACIVTAVNGNTITLSKVLFSHNVGTVLDFGLTIFEEKQMPKARPVTHLSRTPLLTVLSGQGRYGYGRRGETSNYTLNEYNLLAAITMFGGPPIWEIFDQTKVGIDPNTGQVWAPAGILMAYYTEIRFNYIAGYSASNIPGQIKAACASLVSAIDEMSINGAIKNRRAGDTQIQSYAATILSEDIKVSLKPFEARVMG